MSSSHNRRVTKNIFIESNKCLTKGWHLYHDHTDEDIFPGERLRKEEGIAIGEYARELYSEGKLIKEYGDEAVETTLSYIKDNNVDVIFEGAFIDSNCIARPDILIREQEGWHLVEVKSSRDSSIKKGKIPNEKIADLSYTAMIVEKTIELNKISLMTLSEKFRQGMERSKLFVLHDAKSQIESIASDIAENIVTGLCSEKKPEPIWKHACGKCEFFKVKCLGRNIKNPIFDLPRIVENKTTSLFNERIYDIESIPNDFKLSDKQKMVCKVVCSSKEELNSSGLSEELAKISWPAYYLDFETVKTAYPLYPDVAPHEQVLTQYSLHQLNKLNGELRHEEFLADPRQDCRRILIENLLSNLGDNGSIIVYSSFERVQLTSLKDRFPDLKEKMDVIIQRLVDLKMIIEDNYYHPDFHGSYSIKSVLPVLVPSMSYDELAIKDGDSAVVAFVKMTRDKDLSGKEEELRKQLLTYCQQDTLAMVELHKFLDNLCKDFQG